MGSELSNIFAGGDPGIFHWGGGRSKFWFRKDCWTFLWQITFPPHPLPLVSLKKFSQLNSDIQSHRCKDFSLEQVSGLMGGGGGGGSRSPDHPPGSAAALGPFDILFSTAFANSNTTIASYRCTFWNWNTIIIGSRWNKRSAQCPSSKNGEKSYSFL